MSVESFGYLHGVPAGDGLLYDLRDRIRDPHVDPAMREMTGLDEAVRTHVLGTPGASELVDEILAAAVALAGALSPARVLIGCAGGRHRSVVVAAEVAARLAASGMTTTVTHHHVERPVVQRAGARR